MMSIRRLWLLPSICVCLWSGPSQAAKVVHADAVVFLAQARPTHRLVEVSRALVRYGTTSDFLGFVPAGHEREAIAPSAFDVDDQGRLIVADPVRRKVFLVDTRSGTPSIAPIAPLPLRFSDIAVDRNGTVYVADLMARTVTATNGAVTTVSGDGHSMRFVRQGDRIAIRSGAELRPLGPDATSGWNAVHVEKCNAEAGLITYGGRQVQIELGGPLASVQLIGVNGAGDVFLLFERFRVRGRLAVDRRVVVLGALGEVKATLEVADTPRVHPSREFVLDSRGALHQMVPSETGVTFLRWEVRP